MTGSVDATSAPVSGVKGIRLANARAAVYHAAPAMWMQMLVFALSLAVVSWASDQLTSRLERIGARWKFSEGLLGIVTALGADAPETCSAFAAILDGQNEVGLGVVLGSNIFNLAGLLGLSALVAGRVTIGRQGLLFNGGTGVLVTLAGIGLVLQWVSARTTVALLLLILVPYVSLSAMRSRQIRHLPVGAPVRRFLDTATGHIHTAARKRAHIPPATWPDGVWTAGSLALIVAGSTGMVRCAVALAARWHISPAVVGMVVLAGLTSIPNVVSAVRLAREGRGAAVVSEALNSNTLNILLGICAPALALGAAAPTRRVVLSAIWLLGMKLVALLAASHRNGLHRAGGMVLIGLYAIFAGAVITWK